MKEKIPPSFQWYPKDILSSPSVAEMTGPEELAYRRAIDFCWLEGSIPADEKKLAKMLGKNCTPKVAAGIITMFVPHPELEGRLIHERLVAERKKQIEYHLKQKGNIEKRWKKDDTKTIPPNDSGINDGNVLHSAVCNLHTTKIPTLSSARGDLDMANQYQHDFVVQATVNDEIFVEQSALALSTGGIKASAHEFKKYCNTRLAEMKLTGESTRYPLGTVRKILLQDFKTDREKEKRRQRKTDNVHPPNAGFVLRKPLT